MELAEPNTAVLIIGAGMAGEMVCPSSRAAALARLDGFILIAEHYARDRNHVIPGHPSVSRLSPAIRHRLITEGEVVSTVLRTHSFRRVEKVVQEVYWRRYWKSWHFANELVSTGYLHNHARMCFAGWWVHEARLPWQSGAALFFRHLLDGDPASNTLSWRWVAGLQTPGKTYLARRGNLEKYLAPELRDSLSENLAAFENPQALEPQTCAKPPVTRKEFPLDNLAPAMVTGLWIHEEDLAVETSPLGQRTFAAIAVTADADSWNRHQFPSTKRQWISDALRDAAGSFSSGSDSAKH